LIKQTLDQYAATLNKEWEHDRSQTVGASEIGQCMRKTYWSKNEGDPTYGVERDPDYVDSWGAKLRGTIMESTVWAPAMKARYGDNLLYAGPDQVSLVSGFLSATPDGMLIGLESNALADLEIPALPLGVIGATITVECKSIDPRANLDEAKPANIFQTHVQMGMIREQTVYRPTHSLLSYMDASFWDNVTEFVIPFDPAIYAVAKDRATQIMTAKSIKDMEPEGYLAGESECQYCPFTRACGVVRRSVPKNNEIADPQFAAEIDLASKAIAKLEKIVDSEAKQLRKMKQALKDRLREKSVRKIPGIVSWSRVKGRKSYDDEAIKAAAIAAGIDIEQFATRGESTDRLVVAEEKAA
jgi:hypothetical protein